MRNFEPMGSCLVFGAGYASFETPIFQCQKKLEYKRDEVKLYSAKKRIGMVLDSAVSFPKNSLRCIKPAHNLFQL